MIIRSFITGFIVNQGRIVALADGDPDIGDVDFYAVLLIPVTDCPGIVGTGTTFDADAMDALIAASRGRRGGERLGAWPAHGSA